MNGLPVSKLVPGAAALLGAAALALWLTAGHGVEVAVRVPREGGSHSQPQGLARPLEESGELARGEGRPADLPGAWPGFRGPDRDNVSKEDLSLARQWPQGGPPRLWSVALGEGYAGPAVLRGRVYVLDYDEERQADAYRCLSLADGRELWRFSYPVRIKPQHGISRTVVATTDQFVVGMGPLCHVTCLDATSGERQWAIDLMEDYHTQVPRWYTGQCPLIDQGRAILAPGGDALMIAVQCASGEVLWKTPNPQGWQMTHSSVMPVEFAGRRMFVYCASGGVVGVSAEDGTLLWSFPEWRIPTANIPSPLPVGDGRLFLSGGYRAGSMMIRLSDEDGELRARKLFKLEPRVFGSEQQTPILYQGHIYGVRPNGELVCLDLDGQVVWASGREHRFGLGPYLVADGLLFVMNDKGLLTVAVASPEGYQPLDQAQVLDGQSSWGPMALAGGRLLVRDLTTMACLDVRRR
ncbi:MAG: PQQ-binding-like beta-propeller repeat protein [Candidatus Brocadiia bacterium]